MKSKYFVRYKLIIEKLQRSGRVNYQDIESYLHDRFDKTDYIFSYSIRSFQRDKNDIYNIFGIRILNDRRENTYYINNDELSEPAEKLLNAFTITNALRLHNDLSKIISFERQNFGPRGAFYDLIDAIKNKNRIKLYYQKYHTENFDEYILEPLALKEFGKRWYLTASDKGGKKTRTFALDRIISIEPLKETYLNEDFNLEAFFSDYFGIMTDNRSKSSTVVLQFEALQGKYIKSMPLHHSQKIIKDNEDGLQIELKLHTTFDFKQQLLSFGSLVEVISPKILREEMKAEHKKAFAKYT
jgi:hypothetical protein